MKKQLNLNSHLIGKLEDRYRSKWHRLSIYPKEAANDSFKLLILTILSQHTSGENCVSAYNNLSARFAITPSALANGDEEEISNAIKTGGLYKTKTRIIKGVSKEILNKFNGNIEKILRLKKEESKKRLMRLPGVGNKTADILLANRYSYREVIPIDTHMSRLVKRLGLVGNEARYEEMQQALMNFIPARKRERVARLLWFMGKYTCRAQNPECQGCLFGHACKYGEKIRVNGISTFHKS